MKENIFTKKVERLVNPIDVGTLHFIENFTGALPLKVQKKMVDSSAKKTPYMGFVVEPYSYFLAYKLKDLEWAERILPDGFSLIKTRVFEDDEPNYYAIFGVFNAHTSGFWGLRVEFYIIAKNNLTGMLSWIIVDYDTNTISYDQKSGFSQPNSEGSLFTVDYDGIAHVDVKQTDSDRSLEFISDIKNGVMTPLDKRLWIEGNLSIGYGKVKLDCNPGICTSGIFSLIFDPKEFEKALRIPKEKLQIKINNWYPGLFEDEPSEAVCFPYAQHFLSESPGNYSSIKDEDELVDKVKNIDFSKIEIFSTKSIKKLLFLMVGISFLVNVLLLVLLLT